MKGASWRFPSRKVRALRHSHMAGTFNIPGISDQLAFPFPMTVFVFCTGLGAQNTGFRLFFLGIQDEMLRQHLFSTWFSSCPVRCTVHRCLLRIE